MPYSIQNHDGYFMVHDSNGKMYTKYKNRKDAEKQRIAIALSQAKKSGKPVSTYFV
jgi:hypothetical protein